MVSLNTFQNIGLKAKIWTMTTLRSWFVFAEYLGSVSWQKLFIISLLSSALILGLHHVMEYVMLDFLWGWIWLIYLVGWFGFAVFAWIKNKDRAHAVRIAGMLVLSFMMIMYIIPWSADGVFFLATDRYVEGKVTRTEISMDRQTVWIQREGVEAGVGADGLPFKETLKVDDIRFLLGTPYWNTASSDLYGRIDVGQTYCFRVVGIRFPRFSWFRNVIALAHIDKCH